MYILKMNNESFCIFKSGKDIKTLWNLVIFLIIYGLNGLCLFFNQEIKCPFYGIGRVKNRPEKGKIHRCGND